MKRMLLACGVALIALAAWAKYQTAGTTSDVSLAKFMPQGALVYVEGKDFATLLRDWSSSPEEAAWLKSDNYEVFSRSRLFLRLHDAQQEFASAAGLPADTKFLREVAGGRTALGIYDIGKLEMLYVSEIPNSSAIQSSIWQQRAKFQPREAAGESFFVRNDPQSGRTVAFAVHNDYLILGTREDLVAGALSALKGAQIATLEADPWFAEAVRTAKQPGDLRLVVHLEQVAKTPYFRSYWIQQNITAMQSYRSAVSDLYRSASEYREERVLISRSELPTLDAKTIGGLAQLVPASAGYFSAQPAPKAEEVLRILEQEIVLPGRGAAPASQIAPSVNVSDGTTGNATDLEQRIDIAPPAAQSNTAGEMLLQAALSGNEPVGMLKVRRSRAMPDGIFARLDSAVVLLASADWDANKVCSAIQALVGPRLTASSLGGEWQSVASSGQQYFELSGLLKVAVAIRGRYLLVSNDAGLAKDIPARIGQKSAPPVSATYMAALNHSQERQTFYHLTSLLDKATASAAGGERTPEFFSDNLSSLSRSLGQNLARESVEINRSGSIETQTVRYEWGR